MFKRKPKIDAVLAQALVERMDKLEQEVDAWLPSVGSLNQECILMLPQTHARTVGPRESPAQAR
jgi:hypothetical protein